MTGHGQHRLLLALPQSLFDLASGAAVSMRLLACQLASRGWQVRAVCTSATESGRSGLPPVGTRWPAAARQPLPPVSTNAPERWRIADGGVDFEVWALPDGTRQDWAQHANPAFDTHLAATLQAFQPDIWLSFGAEARDHQLAAAAQAQGCAVVLALHNLAYRDLPLPAHDALLMPSAYLARRYAGKTAATIGVLPPPIWDDDTRVASNEPIFFTFFNPEPAKGAELIVRLAAALPALPFLVVGGRAGSPEFAALAQRCGFGQGLANVTMSPGGVPVRDVLALTRAVLMPSLVDEAAGRVAAEALANGIPVLASDSGALPDTVTPGGQVVPLGRDARGLARVDDDTVARWCAAVERLANDTAWQAARDAAQAASTRWQPGPQAAAADAWFSGVVATARGR